MSKRLLISSFGLTFLFGLTLPNAHALWARTHASACYAYYTTSNIGSTGWPSVTPGNPGLYKASGPAFFTCPFDDDDRFPKHSVTVLNVHGYDGSSSGDATAKVCVTYWGTDGGACGTTAYSGGGYVGNFTLQPSLTYWGAAYAGDFGYVEVDLPPGLSPGYSFLRGIYTAN